MSLCPFKSSVSSLAKKQVTKIKFISSKVEKKKGSNKQHSNLGATAVKQFQNMVNKTHFGTRQEESHICIKYIK